MIDELALRIWNRPAFQAEYKLLLQESLRRSTKVTGLESAPLGTESIRRLLQVATHFAASSDVQCRVAAYRIATAIWTLFSGEFENVRDISHFVLGRLGNFPAATFLAGREGQISIENLPDPLWFEFQTHESSNSVQVDDVNSVVFTDFQKRLWDTLSSGVSVAVSAPTSAGKSYALQRFLVSSLRSDAGWGLYVVPTRALLNQVSDALNDLLHSQSQNGLAISTIPVPPEELGKTGGVYVLTQERLHILLESGKEVRFRIAIVDEAQMVAEGARGVILQSTVERLRALSPEVQVFFGSPQTSNPAIFGQIFDIPALEVVIETESPVGQNIVHLRTSAIRTDEVTVAAQFGDAEQELGTVRLGQPVYDRDQTLAYLSWIFGRNEKSLVYARGQAHCEAIADKLVQLSKANQPSAPIPADPVLREFSKFLSDHVHPKYLLVDSVLNGVGFHYGNMPAIVRKTVEEYFDEGRLSHLVCTSTLLHGVNLPARNLFLLDPTKGRDWETAEDIPISSLDFWNLAGRAGRLGKEFEGNVYLIDFESWQSNPLEGAKDQEVHPALATAVRDRGAELVSFVENRAHASGVQQALENTFVKVLNDYRGGRLARTLEKMGVPEDSEIRNMIESKLKEVDDSVDVPAWITERNINVSVFRQQEMFDYLRRRIREIGPEELIPVHPLRPWADAVASLQRVFKRIHTRFEKKPGGDRSQFFYAPLALRWMRGDPLPLLIDGAYNYKKSKQKRNPKIATVIREVLANIEQDLRFRYVKYVTCYNDLLAEALEQTGHSELRTRIPGIALFLELGASSRTMVNLLGLGLSRTAAGIVTERAINKDMTRPEAELWLRSQNWDMADVSPVVLREIHHLLG